MRYVHPKEKNHLKEEKNEKLLAQSFFAWSSSCLAFHICIFGIERKSPYSVLN